MVIARFSFHSGRQPVGRHVSADDNLHNLSPPILLHLKLFSVSYCPELPIAQYPNRCAVITQICQVFWTRDIEHARLFTDKKRYWL